MSKIRGRKRKAGPRTASGRLVGEHQAVIPEAALRRRAEALGIDPDRLLSMAEATRRLCLDDAAGTALGRLTWVYRVDGTRDRRMGMFDGEQSQWITDAMVDAAEAYRSLWVRWHRLIGMPRRHPQGQQFDRRDKAFIDSDPDADEVVSVWDRLRAAETALLACRQYRLVWAVVDAVVIENVAPGALELGERLVALHALRRGLDAIHGALCSGKRKPTVQRHVCMEAAS